jgi:multisubunit Na+/H+ antiporter MnhB subunit
MMTRAPAFDPISAFHWAQSKPGAGGTNAVNTIIVDFRGYDTFGEIIVLGIAALVIYALSEALLADPAVTARLAALPAGPRIRRPPPDDAGRRHPLLLPMAMMVGVYIYLRGHNLPGGGFVAGLVFAIAYLMQYMASGYDWSHARQRYDHHVLIGWGVLVAVPGRGRRLGLRPALPDLGLHLRPPLAAGGVRTGHRRDLRPWRLPLRPRRGPPGARLAVAPGAAHRRRPEHHRP